MEWMVALAPNISRPGRCVVHFYRNVFSHVPAPKVREVVRMLEAIRGFTNDP